MGKFKKIQIFVEKCMDITERVVVLKAAYCAQKSQCTSLPCGLPLEWERLREQTLTENPARTPSGSPVQ